MYCIHVLYTVYCIHLLYTVENALRGHRHAIFSSCTVFSVCCTPLYQSFNLVGTLRHIDSIGLRVERPYSPSHRRIPWYVSRYLAHTHADFDPTMPNMCTGSFYVLQRLNNSCAIYAIYTVVS